MERVHAAIAECFLFLHFGRGGHLTKILLDSLGLLSFVVVKFIISTILKVHVV